MVQTRAEPLGIVLQIGAIQSLDLSRDEFFGLLLQYPSTDGYVGDYSEFITRAHASGAYVVVATDLLALTLLRSPGEFGADVAVGSSQRFGVPLGFGGPHAAFLATKEEFRRQMPGRIIGVSKDVTGRHSRRRGGLLARTDRASISRAVAGRLIPAFNPFPTRHRP